MLQSENATKCYILICFLETRIRTQKTLVVRFRRAFCQCQLVPSTCAKQQTKAMLNGGCNPEWDAVLQVILTSTSTSAAGEERAAMRADR
jgi:hypothetical protein